jgi:hypothetical protein
MANITEEEFYNDYVPQTNHILRADAGENTDDGDIGPFGGTMYETFGPEFDYVLAMARDAKKQRHVWTIIEGDDGEFYLSAGYHIVNRFGYMITKKPWVSGDEEVKLD